MGTVDLINKLLAVFITDEQLLAWATVNLPGGKFNTYIGIDDQNPPRPEQYPLIAVTEIRASGEALKGRTKHEVDIACGVNKETITEDVEKNSHVQEGLLLAESFREQVRDAMFRSYPGKVSISGDAGQVSFFPLFVSGMTLTVETINTNS